MNRWKLNEKVKEVYLPIIKEHIYKIENVLDLEDPYEIELNLSDTPINPYTLWKILEEDLGYERSYQDDNGWEMDFWIHFKKEGHIGLVISGCGITFELILRGEEK